MRRNVSTRLIIVLAVAASAVTLLHAHPVHARRGGDPLAQLEAQKRKTEARKSKRRETLDYQGAEMRDAKKAAEDSKQSQQLQNFGEPNQQDQNRFNF